MDHMWASNSGSRHCSDEVWWAIQPPASSDRLLLFVRRLFQNSPSRVKRRPATRSLSGSILQSSASGPGE